MEPGVSYEETAVKECEEETGIKINPQKLILLRKMRKKSFDQATGRINNIIRIQYAYPYGGLIKDLKIEKGKAEGFEVWKIDDLFKLSDADKGKFIPFYISEEFLSLFDKVKSFLPR